MVLLRLQQTAVAVVAKSPSMTRALLETKLSAICRSLSGLITECSDESSLRFRYFMGLAEASEDEIRDSRHCWTLRFSDAHHEYAEQTPEQLYKK